MKDKKYLKSGTRQLSQLPMIDSDLEKNIENFTQMADRSLKDIFKGEIRGASLIDLKNRVTDTIGPDLLKLYDFRINSNRIVAGMGESFDYEICKIIIGIHHANTVFMSQNEASEIMRSPEYKNQIVQQAVLEVRLRNYAAAYFRNRELMFGERYIYYPVPYMLFAFCMKIYEAITLKKFDNRSLGMVERIANKSLAALSLVEDGFLDSAYMPCRSVIELFVKLMLAREDERLYDEINKFDKYDIDKTNCSKQYSDEFEKLFDKRKADYRNNKVEFMHYGFVDVIDDYHEIVNRNPYSVQGVLKYLKHKSNDDECEKYDMIEILYQSCHGYAHGNGLTVKYPLLHYFEILLILGSIVPAVYEISCGNSEENIKYNKLLEAFNDHFDLLKQQYANRSTENFDMESRKYKYNVPGTVYPV